MEMEVQKKKKSRSLSVYQYFQVLQVEWLVADLRVRIFPSKKDKDYWIKVKEGKRQVVEDIAEKNHLPTIFNDSEMRRAFENKVYVDKGHPNFHYKDDWYKYLQEPLDLLHYYTKGVEVRFEVYEEMKVGIIKSYIPEKDTIDIEFQGEILTLPISEVTRIL